MKVLQKILFVFLVIGGLSLSASAQKDDKDKRPPKNPPTVNPEKKPPPTPEPKKPKPGMAFQVWKSEAGDSE